MVIKSIAYNEIFKIMLKNTVINNLQFFSRSTEYLEIKEGLELVLYALHLELTDAEANELISMIQAYI